MFNSQSNKFSDEGIGSDLSFDSSSGFMNEGGPIKNHKFYNEDPGRPRHQQPPSWFFENCSRQLAERILEKGRSYGNLLVRQSVTFKDNGSYVLSFRRDTPRGGENEHFEVIQAAAGYQINVENVHAPKKCLEDVLNFFREVAGPTYTRPFSTNDLVTIGILWPYYQAVIQPAEPSQNETQQPKTGHTRENKTWTHKQLSAASASSSTHTKVTSQTISGKSSENPFRQKTCREAALAPASLREVIRCRNRDSMDSEDEMFSTPIQTDKSTSTLNLEAQIHKTESATEGTNSEEITNRLSKLYATPRLKTSLATSKNITRPLPPIPIAPPAPLVSSPDSSQNSPASTSQGIPGPIVDMSGKQRLSLRPPMPPPTPTTTTESQAPTESPSHLSTRKRENYSLVVPPPPQSLDSQPSSSHVSFTVPPPPPLIPTVKASSHIAPPVAPPLVPPVLPSTSTPVSPPVPSPPHVAIPVPPPPPPPMPPVLTSGLAAPPLVKSPLKAHMKKVTIVSPTSPEQTSTVKMHKTLPQTKPKPTRRASEGDVHHPAQRSVSVPTNSEIIEEEHPSVRNVRAMFDNPSTAPSIKPIENTNHQKSNERRHSTTVPSPELGHPGKAFLKPPTAALPPPPPQDSVPTSQPPLASGEGKENFKRRLEALMGNVTLKSPVVSPVSPNKPFPILKQEPQTVNAQDSDTQIPANYENIYSEPVNH